MVPYVNKEIARHSILKMRLGAEPLTDVYTPQPMSKHCCSPPVVESVLRSCQ